MAKQKNINSTDYESSVISVGTTLRGGGVGYDVVKSIDVVQQQDSGEWKTLLVLEQYVPSRKPVETQIYVDEIVKLIKRGVYTVETPVPS